MQPDPATLVADPQTRRLFNFSAGPAVLPEPVLDEIRDELPTYPGLGSSILECSHRSNGYLAIDEAAKQHLRDLLGLDAGWQILFLQGGASMQFYQVPLNFLTKDTTADYLDTGTWANKAIKEAKRVGGVNVAASSKADSYTYIPEAATWKLDPQARYLHFTSNNTVYGTQFAETPQADVPLVCDASSDFLSRPIALDRYGLIYAGAQKNIGPAGVTVVLVREEFLATRSADLPTMLDYGTHAKEMFNTPPVFAVYVVEKVLRWLKGQGGIAGIQQHNERKAALLYDAIDATDFYRGTVQPGSRSRMNVTFRLPSEDLEAQFLKAAKAEGLTDLKGHRSVGGIRASLYNACPLAAVEALTDFMRRFEESHG